MKVIGRSLGYISRSDWASGFMNLNESDWVSTIPDIHPEVIGQVTSRYVSRSDSPSGSGYKSRSDWAITVLDINESDWA